MERQAERLLKRYQGAEVLTEQVSGRSLDRPVFNELKSKLVEGDVVVVLSVSRLGRNTEEVLAFIREMKERGVQVLIDDLGGTDVTSTMGKLVLTTLAAVAELQREEILDKQRIGIERAKAEGKYKGKQKSPETIKKCIEASGYIENGLSKEKAAKAAGVGVATLYRYLKEVAE